MRLSLRFTTSGQSHFFSMNHRHSFRSTNCSPGKNHSQESDMMKKILFTCSFLVLATLAAFATHVPEKDAQRAGLNFFFERYSLHHTVDFSSLAVREIFTLKEEDRVLYYIFNVNTKGFVIVSGDDAVIPVLGYSFETDYSPDTEAPQFTAWMKQYSGQIRFAIMEGKKPSKTISDQWNHLLTSDPSRSVPDRTGRDVEPLIFSNWNQGSPYNEMCPADPAGPGGHTYAGCVPTAMGQIMYYYRWPEQGTGSYSYVDPDYGTLQADFGATEYRWNNMNNGIISSNPGIAQLLYHLGVSCDLVYGPDGSGMYNHRSAYSLRTYFKYSSQTQYLFRDSTDLKWDSVIIAHLDRRMPLYYAGWSVPNVNGHAFVCDGYQGNGYFHFNFGWSGSSNGYYYLDTIVAGGGSFNLAQELIINIYPDTVNYSYPQNCNGLTKLNYNMGSLEDGSGPVNDYTHPSDCSWLIDPQTDIDSISSITLTFDHFTTDPADEVTVYDGDSPSSNVLGTFSGNTTPSPVSSTGNKMFVTFRTTGNTGAPGWLATYRTITPAWCKTSTTFTTDTLNLTDGSFRFNYHNNSSCRWFLNNTTGDTLTVYFRSFDTEEGKDVLRIYDRENVDTALAVISGHYDSLDQPQPVSSPSGRMMLLFSTNDSVTGHGWNLYYPKSTVDIREASPLADLRVYPNPATDLVNLRFSIAQATLITVELSTIHGRRLICDEIRGNSGTNRNVVDVSGLSPGVYLLSLKGKDFRVTKKVVITKPNGK
jgi:hypothetical protein